VHFYIVTCFISISVFLIFLDQIKKTTEKSDQILLDRDIEGFGTALLKKILTIIIYHFIAYNRDFS
jgi:hypothetical protein